MIANDELYHHGVLGMKWGVRRYQNKDGSLTPAGERRQNKIRSKNLAKARKSKEAKKKAAEKRLADIKAGKIKLKDMTDDEIKAKMERIKLEDDYQKITGQKVGKQKRASELSDEELFKAVNRLRLENEYKRLNPEKVSLGKKLTDKVVNEILIPEAVSLGKSYLDKNAKEMLGLSDKKPKSEHDRLKEEVETMSYRKRKKELEKEGW